MPSPSCEKQISNFTRGQIADEVGCRAFLPIFDILYNAIEYTFLPPYPTNGGHNPDAYVSSSSMPNSLRHCGDTSVK